MTLLTSPVRSRGSSLPPPVVEASALSKQFGDIRANDQVSVTIYPGEIHVLLGENGAGKSTLMKILYGVHQPDSGKLTVDGNLTVFRSPAQARARGIGMVFQDFRLVPAFSVFENLALAMLHLEWFIRPSRLRPKIAALSRRYGIDVNLDVPLWQLDVGQRQRVEILKVLLTGPRILILDEPTSVLAPTEIGPFLSIVDKLRDAGCGILISTHKIREALTAADRITIMRGGRVVLSTIAARSLSEGFLITQMVGRPVAPPTPKAPVKKVLVNTRLALQNVTLADDRGRKILRDVSLQVEGGEIVGVAGISGNGQRELADALVGLRPVISGRLFVHGLDLTGAAPASFLSCGVSCVPENPPEDTVVRGLSVLEHMMLAGLPERRRGIAIDWRRLHQDFTLLKQINPLDLAASTRQADQLSGGNIQKLALAQALVRAPRVMVACYPTHGLDVATTQSIQNILVGLRNGGTAILIFSEDMSELYHISDKLIVIGHGKLFGPYNPQTTSVEKIAHIMLTGTEQP